MKNRLRTSRMYRHARPVVWLMASLVVWLVAIDHRAVWAQPASSAPASSAPTSPVTAERGITGSYKFAYSGPSLRVKIQREVDAPLMVRLRKSDDTQPAGSATSYEALVIGSVEGSYDLRDMLEHIDGSAATDLPSLPIRIVSTLPKDQRSDLFDAPDFQPQILGGYRYALTIALVTWLAVPLLVYAIHILNRPMPDVTEAEVPAMSLADQLRPLVEAAANRRLSTEEKGRLELLLVHYWRQQAQLPDQSMASSIQQLRSHPEAGPLLNAVESWLHRADTSVACKETTDGSDSPAEILKLLKPYQSVRALHPAMTSSTTPSLTPDLGNAS